MKKNISRIKLLVSCLLLTGISVISLSGCNKPILNFTDSDFDGLYDNIDPNPSSNKYKTVFYDTINNQNTNEIEITMDYRNFLYNDNPVFNADVAQIGACLVADTYNEKTQFVNDKYSTPAGEIFPIYEQFGLGELAYITVGFSDSPNDKCGLYIGNHKAEIDGKKYQFFFTSIHGYIDNTGWASNFDVGGDTNAYKEVFGDCPDWINKKDHKGFSVTAKRVYDNVIGYINDYKDKDFETYFFGCGHSRGGGIMNLLGTMMIDNNKDIKSLFYCYNAPLTTCEDDQQKLKSYTSIFNLLCEEDLVSRVPLKEWGFTLYGNVLYFSHVKNAAYYENIMKDKYPGEPTKVAQALNEFLKTISLTRNGLFEFAPLDEDSDVHEFDTLEEANEFINSLKLRIVNQEMKNCYRTELIKPEIDDDPYVINLYVRPCAFIVLMREITEATIAGEAIGDKILEILSTYDEIATKFAGILIDIALNLEVGISDLVDVGPQMIRTHAAVATVISAKFSQYLS